MLRSIQTCALVSVALFLVLPLALSAEESNLQAEVYRSLIEDQATQDLSPEELAELVNALVSGAERQGITATDFKELPLEETTNEEILNVENTCSYPAFICAANEAFGFSGDDLRLPIALGAASGAVVLVLALILTRQQHHKVIFGGNSGKNASL